MAEDPEMNGNAKVVDSTLEKSSLAQSGDPIVQVSSTASTKRPLHSDGRPQDDRESKRRKGVAPVKEEYLVHDEVPISSKDDGAAHDDDAEAFHHVDRQPTGNNSKRGGKQRGQNKNRRFGNTREEVGLCSTRVNAREFSPGECPFGDKCKFEHDLRKYLRQYKSNDLKTFDETCPVWQGTGRCEGGWKCRFVGSHSREIEHPNGKKELVLSDDSEEIVKSYTANSISTEDRVALTKKKFPTPKSEVYLKWLDSTQQRPEDQGRHHLNQHEHPNGDGTFPDRRDHRSAFIDSPLLPSEKRRLYFGPETPVLAPLTTQGNLPFRRLCVQLGATFTYSEMAMSLPLLQGHKPEWALIKAHSSELQAPSFVRREPSGSSNIVYDYNYSQQRDIKFGAQISASKPWLAIKATETLTSLLPNSLRCVDLNCGCPIDLVYREGAGSALMDSASKLSKMLRGMNAVSGAVPISCKIRMGTKDNHPTAQKLIRRLVLGSEEGQSEPVGVAAITLHGRSRQQRYSRQADWDYISQTSSLVNSLNAKSARASELQTSPEASIIDSIHQTTSDRTDTIHAPDPRSLPSTTLNPSTSDTTSAPPVYFLGNGDIYSPHHYHTHLTNTKCSSLMLARGALIKPWLFSELTNNTQTTGLEGLTDPSSTERLGHIKNFVTYGLEHWGSDTQGVSTTRRFLLEWLSFTCRYIPVGLLETLPPELNHRAPRFRARDELEQLMASDDYRDWVKISEMFLGKAEEGFKFVPKHKSNAHEAEG